MKTITDAGGRAIARQTDVTLEDQVDALFAAAEAAFGPVDLLVNSAGLNMSGIFLRDMSLAQFDRVLRSDLYGPFLTCRRMVRALDSARTPGRIVNISSIHERAPRRAPWIMMRAKGGLAQLTATLALELAPQHIAVNGVAPGMILAPMNQSALDDQAELARKEAAIPGVGRVALEEVADLVAYSTVPGRRLHHRHDRQHRRGAVAHRRAGRLRPWSPMWSRNFRM